METLGFSSFENLTGVGKGFDRRNTEGDQSRTLGRIVELVDEAGRVHRPIVSGETISPCGGGAAGNQAAHDGEVRAPNQTRPAFRVPDTR